MKNLSVVILFFAGLMLFACKQQPEAVKIPASTITLQLANTGKNKIDVYNIEKNIYHEIDTTQNKFTLNESEETILDFAHGRSHSYIHVKPGDNLIIDTLSGKPLVLGVEKPSKENQYLLDFGKILTAQKEAFSLREIAKSEADSFRIKLDNKYAPVAKLVADIGKDETVSKTFKEAMQLRLAANKGEDIIAYKGYYNYLNKKYPEFPEGFYAEVDKADFSNPKMMTFNESRNFGTSWISKDLDYDDFENVTDYFKAVIRNVKKHYGTSLMRDYCLYENVVNQISFGGGIDEAGDMVKDFKGLVTNGYMNHKVNKLTGEWANLMKGADAPDFEALDREGTPIKLSDLKGKKVYVDVWATWCGPCVKEIPALKELEKELHEENIEFVSVSIDKAKDKEKWLKFIKEKEMKGVQLMAENDWKSDVTTAYNIKGIPRFLLIDEAGKIVSANAPRPSDPKTKGVLLN